MEDEAYARIPFATIRMTELGSNQSNTTFTDVNGGYRFSLPKGIYTIKVVAKGFCPEVRKEIQVSTVSQLTINYSVVRCSSDGREGAGPLGAATEEDETAEFPYKKESLRLAGIKSVAKIRFGENRKTDKGVLYRAIVLESGAVLPARLTVGLVQISASSIHFSTNGTIAAQGDAVLEDGSVRRDSDFLEIKFVEGKPQITSMAPPRFGAVKLMELCDVIKDPAKYEWERIRFKGALRWSIFMSIPALLDTSCPGEYFDYGFAPFVTGTEVLQQTINEHVKPMEKEDLILRRFVFEGYVFPSSKLGSGKIMISKPYAGMIKTHHMRLISAEPQQNPN